MAKSLEFYIWVANDTLIGCNVQMALPTASPASLLRRGVLSSGPSLCVLAHRVVLQRRRKETRMRAEEWRACPSPPTRCIYAERGRKASRLLPNKMQQGKSAPGRSCQDAALIWGLGIGSCCHQPGLPLNFFVDHSGLRVGTGCTEGEGQSWGGSRNSKHPCSPLHLPFALMIRRQ